MTLFVGGPRHGGNIEDDSALFTDIVSGAKYVRKPIQFTTAHPVTGRPEWTYERHVFVAESLTQPVFLCHQCRTQVPQAHANTAGSIGHPVEQREAAQQVFAAAQDAIMREWFVTGGTKRRAAVAVVPPSTEDAKGNGAGTPVTAPVVYTSVCAGCSDDGTSATGPRKLAFATLKERAEWAADHIRTTGHELDFGEESTP